MNDEKEIIACVTLMASTLRQELTEPMLRGYTMALGGLTTPQLRMAVGRALCECKFMPAPAELLGFVGVVPLVSRGEEAWAIVRTAMDRYDYTDSMDFGPVVNAVVRQLGGWQYLCDQSIPDLVWRQKEFVAAFAQLAARPVDEYRAGPLAGFLPGPVVRIEAPGSINTPLLASVASNGVSDVVRELADSKAVS